MIECDDDVLEKVVNEVIEKNQNAFNDYKAGNKSSMNFLVGQIKKAQEERQIIRK